MKVNEQNLEKLGFRKWQSNDVVFAASDFFYQKRIEDDRGIKYFVEFVHYAPIEFGNGNSSEEQWMCAMNVNEPHTTFNQHRVEDIEKCLEKCERFFLTMECEHHELKENN